MTDLAPSLATRVTPGAPEQPAIALLGSGLLHAALADSLGSRCHLVDVDDLVKGNCARTDGCAAIAVAADADDTRPYRLVHRYATSCRKPWLPVRVEMGNVLIGPAVLPTESGCPTCVARRRRANRADTRARRSLRQRYGTAIADTANPLVTRLMAILVAALVTDELRCLLTDRDSARTRGAVLRISLRDGSVTRHVVVADPTCPRCATPVSDPVDLALPRPRRLIKYDPSSQRLGALAARWPELKRLYIDGETGVIAATSADTLGVNPIAVARLAPGHADDDSGHGYGRAESFRAAELTAITEALERLAGAHPRGHLTTVWAPYEDIADKAISPEDLGLYPDSWYEHPDFRYVRFRADRPTSWVWGYSFGRAEPVLVPRSYAYYGHQPDDPGFAYECSNGCALGSCLEEAILHGLLEVAERDAFLMTWYARLPAPQVDLRSARDRRIPLLVELIRQRLGYRVMAFTIAMEQRIPAFWVMAVDRTGNPERPHLMCAAAAGPDPERALRAALLELGPALAGIAKRYDRRTAAALVADPDRVRVMEDHAMLYAHPDAYPRLDFLAFADTALPLDRLAPQPTWPEYEDLNDDLAEAVSRYLNTGLDVIAVDTTAPEHRVGGFASAKVIVPGALPMTFGHRYRRIHGLPRLASVPYQLGFTDRVSDTRHLNPHPHPFP